MGDSITAMKKQMEKYEKEMERVDNQTKQRNIDVDRRFYEVMDKLNHMPEMMAAYNKKRKTSQPAGDAMGCETEVEARKQQFVVQIAGEKNKEVMRDDGEWIGGSIPLQFQKISLVQ